MLEKIWPNSFKHWRVTSKKHNAILCQVSTPSKSLGLFWECQSPDAEFSYLPAFPIYDDTGCITMTDDWIRDTGHLLDCRKKIDHNTSHGEKDRIISSFSATENYTFRYDFDRGQAANHVVMLKRLWKGTPDADDVVRAVEFNPSTEAKSKPLVTLVFCVVLVWIVKTLIFRK